ncbi:MAG: NTP transferase domain-containing protein [Synechococcaceae cyanobacterium SM2_3_1]|nr:NTP transferase domain-containing protein [Synechococcaceae cyanobacterium SM2_3_1]
MSQPDAALISHVRKAVIPAAGRGTRLRPATRLLPKELLPIGNTPMIHRAVLELVRGGIDQIVLIISPAKASVWDYFAEIAEGLNCELELLIQPEPTGTANAIALAEPFLQGEPFVIFMPDEVCFCNRSPIAQLCEAYLHYRQPVLALTWLAPEWAPYFKGTGRINLELLQDLTYRITQLLDKTMDPFPVSRSGSFKGVGIGVVGPEFLQLLHQLKPEPGPQKEYDDIVIWQHLTQTQQLLGSAVDGIIFDAGQPQGFAAANRWWLEFCQQEDYVRLPD